MTVPQERENDPLVLDLLGFGTPPAPGTASRHEPLEGPDAMQALDAAPTAGALTRRELRERERAVESTDGRASEPAARRSAPTSSTRTKSAKPRRAAKKSNRRDAVRAAAAPKKSIGKRVLSFAAMLFAGALAVGMTVPANAFDFGSNDPQLAESLALPAQSLEVDPTLVSFSERDTWSVTSWAQMLKLRYGNRSWDYTIGTGPIRWPFPYAVPISSGFGDRAAPCRGCSTYHTGVDFVPGYGAAIFAIADGVVVEHSEGGSTWGNFVVIQHEIDGETVFSGYAHMQSASSPLAVGDVIKVGDFIGLVGATGQVSGAHLHFTISIGDRMNYVDPFTYLKLKAS
jgi:murein DD-endopeptidase MepM/ murein hydrolase activator NlpD